MQGELSDDALRRACGFTPSEAGNLTRLAAALDPCAPRSEAHRRWAAWWAGYAATTLVVGVVADTAAQIGWGYPATLTCGIRRWLGVEPQTRYARAGQAVIVGALGWGALHLSLGILGPTRGKETP